MLFLSLSYIFLQHWTEINSSTRTVGRQMNGAPSQGISLGYHHANGSQLKLGRITPKNLQQHLRHMLGSRMCTVNNLHQWSLALFLLFAPVTLYGRPFDAVSSRMRRSVSHAQLMHDKGRSLQELKRRLWIQDLLEKVHTADESDPPPSRTSSQTYSGSTVPQKPQGATKDLQGRYILDRHGPILPQETNKAVAYQDQPLKVAIKRKKKVRLGRRRESDKKRRKTRSLRTEVPR